MLPAWNEAVLELLERTDIPISQLAEEIGVNRAITHRHLNGRRRPTETMVRRINKKLARMIGNPDVEAFLSAVAAYEADPIDYEGPTRAFEGFDMALNRVSAYLKDGAKREIADQLRELPVASISKLLNAVQALIHKRLIRRIDGDVPKAIFVDDLCDLFLANGLDLRQWLLPNDQTTYERREDEFELLVERAVAQPGILDVQTRNRVTSKILRAFTLLRRDDLAEQRHLLAKKHRTIEELAKIALGDTYEAER